MNIKKKVIIVTDGDQNAKRAVELAAKNIGGCCISLSAGNPTPITGEDIVALVKSSSREPVLVMLDDRGCNKKGAGEKALEYLARHPEIELLGVVAVASNTDKIKGVRVTKSVAKNGEIIKEAVDKEGNRLCPQAVLKGDTVDVLNNLDVPIVVGTGDTGKMEGHDDVCKGSPVTTKALEEILSWNNF